MSLVAYGDSDSESDPDDAVTTKPSTGCVNVAGSEPFLTAPPPDSRVTRTPNDRGAAEAPAQTEDRVIGRGDGQEKIEERPLFPTLPNPKAGGKVKIIIPSLNEFYDEDDDYQPKRKTIKPSNSGCGLFSMLPDPKNKKTSKASTTISMVPRATMCKMTSAKEESKLANTEIKCFEPRLVDVEDHLDEDNQEDVDFLGLNKIGEIPDVAPVVGFDLPEIKTNITTIIEDDTVYGPVYCPKVGASDIYEDDETKLTLDSNALKQLGDRDKTHIKQVEVINVNMSQVLEESQQWLQKNMTEEYAESKNVSSDINITGQSKRKHQITYLAQQAKANELKLKNMWAENRMTRKQTQAKYGF